MSTPVSRPPASVPLRLAIGLVALGGVAMAASLPVAYLIADHSSSDSSPSSLIAIGLGGYGFLTILLGGALLGGIVLARLWRRSRRPHGGTGA
jgi:hypothetical protein